MIENYFLSYLFDDYKLLDLINWPCKIYDNQFSQWLAADWGSCKSQNFLHLPQLPVKFSPRESFWGRIHPLNNSFSQTYWSCMYFWIFSSQKLIFNNLYFIYNPQSEEDNSCFLIKDYIGPSLHKGTYKYLALLVYSLWTYLSPCHHQESDLFSTSHVPFVRSSSSFAHPIDMLYSW